jgi:hypothetical protein
MEQTQFGRVFVKLFLGTWLMFLMMALMSQPH